MSLLISTIVSIIGQIAGAPGLIGNIKIERYSALIVGLTNTLSSLLQRGDEGLADLKAFKAECKALRAQVLAGELPSDEILARLAGLKAQSDAAHQQLQDLKPAAAPADPPQVASAGGAGGGE